MVGGLFDFMVGPNPNWSFGSSFGCGVWQYETLKHKRQKMNHKILECKWNNPMELKQAWLSAWVLQMLSMLGCWMVQPS